MQLSAALPIGLVLALGVGTLLGRTVFAPKPSDADAPASAAVASAARIHELEAMVSTLQAKLGDAAELAAKPGPLVAAPSTPSPLPEPNKPDATPPAEAAMSEPAASRQTAQIVVPGFEKALDDVDWAEVGKNLHAMPTALTKFVTQWAKDGAVPIELAGEVQKHNGPLLTAAGKLSKSLKLANPNVAFTHPAFQANAIAAALESAGHRLDDAQRASILKLVQTAVDDEASRAGRYDERTLEVRKLIDRADVRDQFFDGVRALLTPEQRAVLGSEEWRGRVQADLYSSGLVWSTVAQGLPTTDREAFVARFSGLYAGQFGVPAASAAEFTTLVGEWAREIPDAVFNGEPDPRDAVGLVRVAYVTDFAKRQAALQDRAIERLKLDDATIQKIRTFAYVLFPIHVKAATDPK